MPATRDAYFFHSFFPLTLSLGSDIPACVPDITCCGRGLKLTFPRWPASPQCRTPADFFFKHCKKPFECKPASAGPLYISLKKCFLFCLNVLFWVGTFPSLSLFCFQALFSWVWGQQPSTLHSFFFKKQRDVFLISAPHFKVLIRGTLYWHWNSASWLQVLSLKDHPAEKVLCALLLFEITLVIGKTRMHALLKLFGLRWPHLCFSERMTAS